MLSVFILTFCALIALGFGAAAARSDFNRLIIPNIYSVYIAAAFIPAFLAVLILAPDASMFYSWKSHLLGGLIVFAITYALFYFNLIGGGDSKLLSVFALWAGLGGLLPLIFFMALIGGFLGVATLALAKWKPVTTPKKDSWLDKAQSGSQEVPYGIAIFGGAIISFWQNGYINPQSLVSLAQSAGS